MSKPAYKSKRKRKPPIPDCPSLSDEPQPGSLDDFDLILVARIAFAARRADALPLAILLEVFQLSPEVRRRLSHVIPDVQLRCVTPPVWHRRCAELYEICERARRPRMVADVWIMSPEQWRARYDLPTRTCYKGRDGTTIEERNPEGHRG